MNNIVRPRRTDARAIWPSISDTRFATGIAIALFAVVIISFKPFVLIEATTAAGGDIVNQIGFGSIGAVSIFALMAYGDPRKVVGLISPSFALMIGFLLLSVSNATDPSSALRSASFTLIGILAMATVLVIPRDADAFSSVLLGAGLAVVGLCYFGILAVPTAIHQDVAPEPLHEGLWRGVFSHKNIAGPVMACFSFCGLYVWRRGQRRAGAALLLAAMIFMINTGSKTTAGVVPLSIAIVILPGLFGMRFLTPVLFAVAIIGTALATLGIVFIEPIKHFATINFPDLTYTGRVTLWEFSGEMIAKRPWTGYGFDSFWGTDFLLNTDEPFDRAWDIRPMVHGHNSYLDTAVIMGIPALLCAIWAFFIAPIRDYMAVPMRRENVYLADLFMMILLFTALNGFLESFFFRRADPVWMFFVFSLFGLRQAARFPAHSASRQPLSPPAQSAY